MIIADISIVLSCMYLAMHNVALHKALRSRICPVSLKLFLEYSSFPAFFLGLFENCMQSHKNNRDGLRHVISQGFLFILIKYCLCVYVHVKSS